MSWRPAKSLEVLRAELDSNYPGWLFLGFLGDAAHTGVPSDHNPNAAGVVCALDIGPGGGLDIHGLADRLLANHHPDLKYLISNRRIAGDWTGWKWAKYDGSDPHDTHIHVSVGRGDDGKSTQPYDDTNKWNVKGEEMGKWDNGKTYNLLFHACNAGIAKRAQDANYVGYFGAADGKDAAEAFDGIVSSPQFDFLVDEARKANHVPTDAEDKLNKIKAIVG